MRNKLIGTKGGTPAGIAEREHRLSTPRPVATSALAHPVRRKTPQSGFLEEAEAMPAESPPVVDINCRICSYRILSYYLNCEIDPFSFDQLYYFQRYFIVFSKVRIGPVNT